MHKQITTGELGRYLESFHVDTPVSVFDMKTGDRIPVTSLDWIFEDFPNSKERIVDLHINEKSE